MAINVNLDLFDNNSNNAINNSIIYTNVSISIFNSISNIVNDADIGIYSSLVKYTNSSAIFYNPIIKTNVSLNIFASTSNIFRPIFIEKEFINVSLNKYTNNNIINDTNNVSFNFLRNLRLLSNTPVFYPITIGSNRIIQLVGTLSNISYIYNPIVNIENIAYKGIIKKRNTVNRPKKFKFKFSDISFDMFPHPLTGDIPVLYDVDAINQCLNNIIKTRKFERPFSSYNISSNIHELLFELSGATLEAELKNVLFNAIVNSEPRILLYEINVKNIPETNSVSIQIYYQIRTIDTIEKFDTVLKRT